MSSAVHGRRTGCWTPSRYRLAAPAPGAAVLQVLADGADDVAGHRGQLRAPRPPAVVPAGREFEVPVVSAGVAVLLVEHPAVAHRLVGLPDHGGLVAARPGGRSVDP